MTDILPRNIRLNISTQSQRHWLDGNADRTALCDALSISFPVGERYFVKSVRHFRDRITDPALLAQIDSFVAQEANHSREHASYNEGLKQLGYDVALMEGRASDELDRWKRALTALAVTCALEHVTAALCEQILKHPSYLDGAPEIYRDLWFWHALEELEHTSVPYDVFRFATRDMPGWERYLLRVVVLLRATWAINFILLKNIRTMLRTDGRAISARWWLAMTWKLFGRPGLIRKAAPFYLRYLAPGFDPGKRNRDALLDEWRVRFENRAG